MSEEEIEKYEKIAAGLRKESIDALSKADIAETHLNTLRQIRGARPLAEDDIKHAGEHKETASLALKDILRRTPAK